MEVLATVDGSLMGTTLMEGWGISWRMVIWVLERTRYHRVQELAMETYLKKGWRMAWWMVW